MTYEDGRFRIDGYPEGSSVCGLRGHVADSMKKFSLFFQDLEQVCRWLDLIDASRPIDTDEPLAMAALIRFVGCFRPAKSGIRRGPLKVKKVFGLQDRYHLERLVRIRNRKVVHDEHVYPGEFPLIVLDRDATALDAVMFRISTPFSAMEEVDQLRRMSRIARDWVYDRFTRAARRAVVQVNAMAVEEREELLRTRQFTVQWLTPEDRF